MDGGNLGFLGGEESGVTGLISKRGKRKKGKVGMGTRDCGWVRVSFLLPFSDKVSCFFFFFFFA